MKYIILDDGELERGIAFPETIQHRDMANACKRFGVPISAGFVSRDKGCHGESDSLSLKSKPEDADFFAGLL